MKTFTIHTNAKKQVVDITAAVEEMIEIKEGVCHVFIAHTTAALTTADLDPGTDLDLIDAFKAMVPKLTYRHPHDPGHVGDHIMSALIGPSVTIPVKDNKLVLGTWQRVVLIEFDGPKERTLYIVTK